MTHDPVYRRILHRMGYYNYQQGLIYRHLDQEGGWESHLHNSRRFILKAAAILNPVKVTVLGSGWLLDFPLKEIAEMASEVCLVDIVHPPEVINQVRTLPNVKLKEDDVTGGLIREVWEKCAGRTFFKSLRSLCEIRIPEYQPDEDPGMVVSLNILTQLESLPLACIRKRVKARESEYYLFRKEIQKKHIDFLNKHESVLITDLSEVVVDNMGKVTEEPSVVTDLPRGRLKEEWTWCFEDKRPDYYTRRSDFKVLALVV